MSPLLSSGLDVLSPSKSYYALDLCECDSSYMIWLWHTAPLCMVAKIKTSWFPLARWSSASHRAKRRQLSLLGFHWPFWEPHPWSCGAVLQGCTGTNTHTESNKNILYPVNAEGCFSLSVCPVSPVRTVLCRTATGGIHRSVVSIHPLLCVSSPSSPTTTLWETACHGNNLIADG